MPHPQHFSGESVVSWSDLDITISVPWYLGLMFRTRKEDGVLMEAAAGSSRLLLQVGEDSPHPGSCRAGACLTGGARALGSAAPNHRLPGARTQGTPTLHGTAPARCALPCGERRHERAFPSG